MSRNQLIPAPECPTLKPPALKPPALKLPALKLPALKLPALKLPGLKLPGPMGPKQAARPMSIDVDDLVRRSGGIELRF